MSIKSKIDGALAFVRKPGCKPELKGKAPTQIYSSKLETGGDEERCLSGITEVVKQRRLDRWLDAVVAFSGSRLAFASICAGLLAWLLLGIKLGHNENWQVIISDVQALLCYVYDSFLTRQQLNAYNNEMVLIIQLQSRGEAVERMLGKVQKYAHKHLTAKATTLEQATVDDRAILVGSPPVETRFDKAVTWTAMMMGHIVTLGLFWVGIVVWIGLGPSTGWSDQWQLYMNSATSVLMVLTFALLANIRERHATHDKYLCQELLHADAELELKLRCMTQDDESNHDVVIRAPEVGKIQRAIFYYADFVGTLVGIAIMLSVICVWVAIGPALKFSSNWWLLIGTYAGLIGMFDGFVLRNMQARLREYSETAMLCTVNRDRALCELSGQRFYENESEVNHSLVHRLSNEVDQITSHEYAVVLALGIVIGLVTGSSAMGWSLTGQLLSNVPPSIIESWLMLVLITGHNSIEERKRNENRSLVARRRVILEHLKAFQQSSGMDDGQIVEIKEE